MVYDGIILGILIGLFRGGNFKGIATLKLKGGWIFPILLLVQWIFFLLQDRIAILANISNITFIIVYIVGLTFIWLNRHYPGMKTIFAGVLLNFVVIALNGGRMPVSLEATQAVLGQEYVELLKTGLYGKHTAITADTIFPFLGDIIPLAPPYPRAKVISIGDVVMNIGVFLFIQYLMMKEKQTDSLQPTHEGR
ncbi:DUF5317 domain-containing protein [Anoxybacillus flavithermus]|uniref:DUF5317 domain-containing protein n=1 Tax=Anoxybacillus flavithermus AK1 TaxID=1297581 RepID=M8DZ30_9BACL|nr:DUF5317 domain-containing protein [Anoxybacillus flavithermus]EMT45974.1 hypothetical protein H919_07781 [Anoxybacillus flavithermus AK1]